MGYVYPLFEWDTGIKTMKLWQMTNNKISWLVKKLQFNMKTTMKIWKYRKVVKQMTV